MASGEIWLSGLSSDFSYVLTFMYQLEAGARPLRKNRRMSSPRLYPLDASAEPSEPSERFFHCIAP